MKRALLLLSLLIAVPLAHANIQVDYDQDYPYGTTRTYGWKKTPGTDVGDLAHKRIVAVVGRYMEEFGLTESDDPDVWVTYHGNTQDKVVVDVRHWGYAYPSRMYWGPYWRGYYGTAWDSTATTRTYTEGTLVIDVIDADSDQLIWRGTATGTIPDRTKKQEKALQRAVAKMMKKWKTLRRQQERRERRAG